MIKHILLGVILLSLALFALGQEPVTYDGGQASVTVDPSGAKIKIRNADGSAVFTHTFTQIQEIASDGGVVNAVNSFAGLNFNNPPQPQEQFFQGVNATMVMLNGNIPVSGTEGASTSASLTVRLYVFNQKGKINYGAKAYDVDVNSVEIVYTLAGWPLQSSNNTINFRVRISTPGDSGSWSSPELRLFDGATLVFAPDATTSNGEQEVVVSASNGNSAVDVTMQFKAANTIDYDPLMTLRDVSSASSLRSFLFDLFW